MPYRVWLSPKHRVQGDSGGRSLRREKAAHRAKNSEWKEEVAGIGAAKTYVRGQEGWESRKEKPVVSPWEPSKYRTRESGFEWRAVETSARFQAVM